jgi:glucokinase
VRHVIALDVGGTGMKAALVGAEGTAPAGALIIGGGLAEAGDTLFAPLRAAVGRRVTFQKLPSIVPAALGDTAGCLGVGLMAWELLTTTTPATPAPPTTYPEVAA